MTEGMMAKNISSNAGAGVEQSAVDRPPLLSITEAAACHIRMLLGQNTEAIALRLGVGTKGCSGHSYEMSYTSELKPWDETVEKDGAKVAIDATALMFIIGTTIDYCEDKLQSGFVFNNPNETGRCGCGESFHIENIS